VRERGVGKGELVAGRNTGGIITSRFLTGLVGKARRSGILRGIGVWQC